MISDYVKGKKKFDFPVDVQHGIMLHRFIDAYTDAHPATKEAKIVFRPAYRLYSGAMVDVVYDHFLAIDETVFPNNSLYDFSLETYKQLDENTHHFPSQFAAMYPYMKSQNWLYNYRTTDGIHKSLGGVVRRATYLTEADTAFQLFQQHFQLLQDCYRLFWTDLVPQVKNELNLLG